MSLSPLAGKLAPESLLVNIPRLVSAYYTVQPDPSILSHRVAFGTSGHRGSSTEGSFTDSHIAAISQATAEYRASQGITGPLFMGMDTHALSESAWITALEVLAANGVEVRYQTGRDYTPTPLVSYAILTFNKQNPTARADGIVITPSHNPPQDGGFKYNPPSGGPADTNVTKWIQDRANALLEGGLKEIKRIPLEHALALENVQAFDFITPYVEDLPSVINLEAIQAAGIRMGVDPLGGSSLPVWGRILERWNLDFTLVNERVDPRYGFMSVDRDGKIRMDCSSPYAMAGLLQLKDSFDLSVGNDPDADRHGIVTPDGLMNPNHYLAVCGDYLFTHRPAWATGMRWGKTLVSSALIDRVAAGIGRGVLEVPVGFKYFVEGLLNGSLGFVGEESAGASFLRLDGSAWCTDKDGLIPGLLAAEMLAVTGKTPSARFKELETLYGSSAYTRMDAPALSEQKKVLSSLSPEQVTASSLAGEPITAKLTRAPGNGESIGGLKVTTENAWFAARPSGTEDVYKIYAESFKGADHLEQVLEEAQAVVGAAFKAAGL